MTRQEAIEEGGFVWMGCRVCGREFWADEWAWCDLCRASAIKDDERRREEEGAALDWESLIRHMEELWTTN